MLAPYTSAAMLKAIRFLSGTPTGLADDGLRSAQRRKSGALVLPPDSDVELEPNHHRVSIAFLATRGLRNGEQRAARLLPPDTGLPLVPVDRRHDAGASPSVHHRRRVTRRHRREGPPARTRNAEELCAESSVVDGI